MGAEFQFTAKNAKTGSFTQVEVFVGGAYKGFTKENGMPLSVTLISTGTFEWYAKKFGKTVDRGRSSGGRIQIFVDPNDL